MAQYLHAKKGRGSDGLSDGVVTAEDFPSHLGAIGEFLTLSKWDDGQARATGSISIFFEEGVLKAAVNDKDSKAVSFISAESWASLWDAIERGLREDSLSWRRSKPVRKG